MPKTKKKKPNKKPSGNKNPRTKANPTGTVRTALNRQKLLEVIEKTGRSLTFAANLLGIGHTAAWAWKREDKDFSAAVDDAINGAGTDRLEDVAMLHAEEGWEEPLTYQGEISYKYNGYKYKAYKKADGSNGRRMVPDWLLDKKGNKIPETIRRFDHNLMTRMLDRRRPVAEKREVEVGPDLAELLTQMNKEDRKEPRGKHPKDRTPYLPGNE